MDEAGEKMWILERIQIVIDDTMQTLEAEKDEHTKLAEGLTQRIFDIRNSLLAGLGFIASMILAMAAIGLLSTLVIESVFIIGAIGFAAYYIINTINVKITQILSRVWFGYYASIKMLYGVKRFIVMKSIDLENLTKEDCMTMWIVTNLMPGISGNVLFEAYEPLTRSYLLNQFESHFKFKAAQAKGDVDEGYEAYLQVKEMLTNKKDLFPEEIMKLLELYEKRLDEKTKTP